LFDLTKKSMSQSKGKFEAKHSEITGAIIGVFFDVHKELGYGFSEKVYENALAQVLREQGFDVKLQMPTKVYFRNQIIGEYVADVVLLKLKAAQKLNAEHAA